MSDADRPDWDSYPTGAIITAEKVDTTYLVLRQLGDRWGRPYGIRVAKLADGEATAESYEIHGYADRLVVVKSAADAVSTSGLDDIGQLTILGQDHDAYRDYLSKVRSPSRSGEAP